jgi:hypothetical protein
LRCIGAGEREVHQRGVAGDVGFLLEQHDLGAGLDRALALVGLDQVRDQPEQRGLAHAVAPDQRQPVARPDVQVELAEQPAPALLQAQAFPGEDRCVRHCGAPLRRSQPVPQGTAGFSDA